MTRNEYCLHLSKIISEMCVARNYFKNAISAQASRIVRLVLPSEDEVEMLISTYSSI